MLFSIIIPHYDKSISDERFELCLQSIANQEFKDFEVLIYHDGELNRPLSPKIKELITQLHTKIRLSPYMGVWGHNNRDIGIKQSIGDYIIHLNSDNILYDLKEIAEYITKTGFYSIYIFRLIMKGCQIKTNSTGGHYMIRTRNPEDEIILRGTPKRLNIDCMQLVAKREIWIERGGWNNFEEESDGIIYESLCKVYAYKQSDIIIGEHW